MKSLSKYWILVLNINTYNIFCSKVLNTQSNTFPQKVLNEYQSRKNLLNKVFNRVAKKIKVLNFEKAHSALQSSWYWKDCAKF